jgi:Na+/H+ antiporter NhaD/arsenite permease-like protein
MLDYRRIRDDMLALGLLAAIVFVGMSLLSYHPADPPANNVYPAADVVQNWCGPMGARVAHALCTFVGVGAWVVLVVMVTADVHLFSRREDHDAAVRWLGAALLLLISSLHRSPGDQSRQLEKIFSRVEWITIFFFMGLFVIVYGVERTGLLEMLAHRVLELTGGDATMTTISIIWASAVASALVDNIPFVATMIPMIENMSGLLGGPEALRPLWWALALGSCLGGNGSLVGASANLIVAGFAERAGHPLHFMRFMLIAFPLMLGSVAISTVYVYLRYL